MTFRFLIAITVCGLFGCGPTRVIIQEPLDKTAAAVDAVAQEMRFAREVRVTDFNHVPGATDASKAMNASGGTDASGATPAGSSIDSSFRVGRANRSRDLVFTRKDGSEMAFTLSDTLRDETYMTAYLRLRGLHPASVSSRFFLGCLSQEFAIESGARRPFANPRKEEFEFVGWNTLSPIFGEVYMSRNNPFVPPSLHYYNLVTYGLADATAWSLIGIGLAGQGRKARNSLVAGMAVAGIFRFLGLNGLSFVMRYDEYYQVKYELGNIRF